MTELTADQIAKREANKQRAIQKLQAARQRLAAQKGNTASGGGGSTNRANGSSNSSNQIVRNASTGTSASASSSGSLSAKANENGKRTSEAITGGTENAGSSQHRKANQPAPRKDFSRKLVENYIEYDFAKIKDSKGGFMSEENTEDANKKMIEEWKQEDRLNQAPTILDGIDAPRCFECDSLELDFKLFNIFKCRVCKKCREKFPDKYSLLTKTECREDYLLTDPELRDEELLPHMERPNPHKSTFNNMMLYLRYQVEEFAFKKWDGPEGLDAEYEKRVAAKKERKDKKFLAKLKEMRRTTRAHTLSRGDGHGGQHVHEWSVGMTGSNGMVKRRCALCGMTTEEFVMG